MFENESIGLPIIHDSEKSGSLFIVKVVAKF